MSDNRGSEFGKSSSGVKTLTGVALNEARTWAEAIMDAEFRGRGDREKSVRFRVSRRTGVPESYLRRLRYKSHEMKDVAGSVYRALQIAYDDMCRRNEEAADRHRAERLSMDGHHEAADEKFGAAAVGVASASLEAPKEAER